MTFKHKLSIVTLVAAAAAALTLFLSPVSKAQAQTRGHGVRISGTIYGIYDVNFEGVGAWIGRAMISFDNQPPLYATFVDRNNSFAPKRNGAFGAETISLKFADSSGTFDIVGQFEVSAASTPGLFALHEVGFVANGTGNYANVSGQVSIQGPAVEAPSEEGGAPMWISEIHGVLLGVK